MKTSELHERIQKMGKEYQALSAELIQLMPREVMVRESKNLCSASCDMGRIEGYLKALANQIPSKKS